MSKFAQKLSDNIEKIVFALISEINESEKLLSEEAMKFCSLFKTCNFSSKIFTLFWINLSSYSLRNFFCLCKQRNLTLSWVNFSRSCCWQEQTDFSFFFKNFSAQKVWQTFKNHESFINKHDFLEQTHSLQFLNLSEKTQDLLIWQHKKHLRNISIFFSFTSWDKRKWSTQHFNIVRREKNYWNNELKKRETNVTELIKKILVTWLELEQNWQSWQCQT